MLLKIFRVSLQGEFSSFKDILSVVPQGQGTVSGPLLFILFINNTLRPRFTGPLGGKGLGPVYREAR